MREFFQSLVSYPNELGSVPGFLQTEPERVGVFFAFWSGFVFCECFLGCVYLCLLECKKRATGKKKFFAAEEPIFSPTVLRFESFGHSANESLTSSAIRPCGYSHCLFMSVSVCSCVCVQH